MRKEYTFEKQSLRKLFANEASYSDDSVVLLTWHDVEQIIKEIQKVVYTRNKVRSVDDVKIYSVQEDVISTNFSIVTASDLLELIDGASTDENGNLQKFLVQPILER